MPRNIHPVISFPRALYPILLYPSPSCPRILPLSTFVLLLLCKSVCASWGVRRVFSAAARLGVG
ncbi:predicted protein [Plenodomus lingam JN3]|uniref:Predicted protein n=1 Tax=Leptosphaeria maculans (strain JN3 / isolate v23.1.3 / race Av1-4-5-6-7-8) TaxID=985895 RepID=E5A900_LEPMJ|nr:predicted protein [Plenodomus lingam JN3]CBY00095.1 predicted protein [Plenodomus lingam JN3]